MTKRKDKKMKSNYQNLMDIVKNEKTVSGRDIFDVVSMLSSNEDEEFFETDYFNTNKKRQREVAKLFTIDSIKIEANANDYHNIAVEYARSNLLDCALVVLDKGIIENPNNIDLLADIILYGVEGGRRNKSKLAYNQIKKAGKARWNWRVYSFTLEYLIDIANTLPEGKRLDEVREEAFKLADDYIFWAKQNPRYLDRAYYDKSKVVKTFGGDLSEEKVLLEGLKVDPSAPLCSLQLIDVFENHNKFDEVLKYLNNCQMAVNKPQPDVDPAYVYLRLGMTKASKLISETKDVEYGEKDNDVKSIYKDFHTVLKLQSALTSYKQSAKSIIKILEVQTGIEDTYESKERTEFI